MTVDKVSPTSNRILSVEQMMEQNRRILFPAAGLAEPVFGAGCRLYEPLVNAIAPRVLAVEYSFEDNDSYEAMLAEAPHQALQTYWREMLYRAHMAATMSMVRTSRLVDAVVREYHADNLLGWTSCCRALIEASGDSLDALMSVSVTLAEGHRGIAAHLAAAKVETMRISKELEDTLIHFTHARRLGRNDNAPANHKAKSTHEYIRGLEKMKIPKIVEFYVELCGFMHPAMNSTAWMLGSRRDSICYCYYVDEENVFIKHLVAKYEASLHEILMPAFNPVLLIFKVLHKFKMFPNLPELRRADFSTIPVWRRIEAALAR